MEEKKQSGLVVALVVAIIAILGLSVYICYDKGIIFNNSKDKEVPTEDQSNSDDSKNDEGKIEEVDINSDIVQNLYSIFRFDRTFYLNTDGLNNNNLVKLRLVYDNIPKSNITQVECSKLETSESFDAYCGEGMSPLMAEAYNARDMTKFKEYEKQNSTYSVSASLIEAKFHELFGSDYKVAHESFGVSNTVNAVCHFMKYDQASNLYARFSCEGGGTGGGYRSQQLVSASKRNKELYIVTTLTLSDGNQPDVSSTTKVTYTFKKDEKNDNYVFVKVVEE